MQTVLFVKIQSQIRNTGSTSESHPGHENDSPTPPRETTVNTGQRVGRQHQTQHW